MKVLLKELLLDLAAVALVAGLILGFFALGFSVHAVFVWVYNTITGANVRTWFALFAGFLVQA